MKVNKVVQTSEQEPEGPRIRVTRTDIQEAKNRHILENLCYSPEEAGSIFGKSAKWAVERVKDGKLVAVDENAKRGKTGLQLSQGMRITALSITQFRLQYEIPPDALTE